MKARVVEWEQQACGCDSEGVERRAVVGGTAGIAKVVLRCGGGREGVFVAGEAAEVRSK